MILMIISPSLLNANTYDLVEQLKEGGHRVLHQMEREIPYKAPSLI